MDFDTEADAADGSNVKESSLTDTDNGLVLDGVGNEVWIGLFSTAAIIGIVKALIDKLFSSMHGAHINDSGDAQSQTNNQGKVLRWDIKFLGKNSESFNLCANQPGNSSD